MARITKAEKAEAKRKQEERIAAAVAIVQGGKCPYCGAGLRRNLALTGWWQCRQFGAVGFRENADKPSCSFQTFTQ